MNKLNLFVLLLFFFPTFLDAQLSADDRQAMAALEDSLVVDAFLVVNDTVPARRFQATKDLIFHLKSALRFDHSFQYRFDRLKSVSIQYAPDSSFRVFTWQLMVTPGEYRYFGAIQRNTREVTLIPLADRSPNFSEPPLRKELTPFSWYGALYYRVMQVKQGGKDYYLLFGYDALDQDRRQKIMEVLTFEEGKPVFGAPIVPDANGGVLHRLILQYHRSSSVRLNYDPALELITFDHLITILGKHGEGPMVVSDGSYSGIEIQEDGSLVYVPKIFDQILDEPPREEPVLDRTTRDLFGRPKKKNDK